ncbi:MAG: cysteine-rich CWC family protein [Rubrivivax sp.]|nr:cysteine-rich CWC family protein [Rubrivivax sp.]
MSTEPQASDRCPRCGATFACGAAGPDPCACTTVTLGAALQERLRTQFRGCLCLACLRALAQPQAAGDRGGGGGAATGP